MRPYLVDEHKVWMVKLLDQPPHAPSLKILIRFSTEHAAQQLASYASKVKQDIKRSKTTQIISAVSFYRHDIKMMIIPSRWHN